VDGVADLWEVVGRPYRGFPHGTIFPADLRAEEARRAIARGDIRLVKQGPVRLDKRRAKPPRKRKED
jgi:hypothetical protein